MANDTTNSSIPAVPYVNRPYTEADVTTTFYKGSREDSTLLNEVQYVIVTRNSDKKEIDIIETREKDVNKVVIPVYRDKDGNVIPVSKTLRHTVEPNFYAYIEDRKKSKN